MPITPDNEPFAKVYCLRKSDFTELPFTDEEITLHVNEPSQRLRGLILFGVCLGCSTWIGEPNEHVLAQFHITIQKS